MKTKLVFISFLFFILGFCNIKAQESLPVNGLLWKITGNGLPNPSYLFGTFHKQGGMQVFDTIKSLDSVFRSTNQLICEFYNMSFSRDEYKNNSVSKNKTDLKSDDILKPWPVADSTYDNILTKTQKNILDSATLKNKLFEDIQKTNIRPIMALIKSDYNTDNNSKNNNIIDKYFQQLANKCKMNIVGLDTREERVLTPYNLDNISKRI